MEKARPRLQDIINECAPWRFAALLESNAAALAKKKLPALHLLPITQLGASGWVCASLLESRDRKPTLDVVRTGSNERLPESEWKRPSGLSAKRA
jgi:hypothetical protein